MSRECLKIVSQQEAPSKTGAFRRISVAFQGPDVDNAKILEASVGRIVFSARQWLHSLSAGSVWTLAVEAYSLDIALYSRREHCSGLKPFRLRVECTLHACAC